MAGPLKIECRLFEDEMFIENADGYMLANLYRTAKRGDIGGVDRLVDEDCCLDATPNVTTDEQWHGIVDLFSAAPEMLAVLKEVDHHFRCPNELTYDGLQGLLNAVASALAKAEPVRKVKKRMLVTVEVEVEAPADTHLDAIKNHAFDSVYHTGGTVRGDGVVKFVSKTVTTLGELYEE